MHQVAALIARLVEGRERQLQLARENGALSERLVGLEHELRRLRDTPASDEFVPESDSAPEPGPEAEHPERPWCVAGPPNAPSGCAPGLPPSSLPTADADTPGDGALSVSAIPTARALVHVSRDSSVSSDGRSTRVQGASPSDELPTEFAEAVLVGPVQMPLMDGPVAPRWPGERRADELREQSEEVTLLHCRPKSSLPHGLWVVVTSQVSDGRRLSDGKWRRPATSPPKPLVNGPPDTTAWSGAEIVVVGFSLIVSITVCSIMALWWVLR